MLSTCAGEETLKQESERHLWNHIFNAVVDSINKTDRDGVIPRYMNRDLPMTSYMAKGDSRI